MLGTSTRQGELVDRVDPTLSLRVFWDSSNAAFIYGEELPGDRNIGGDAQSNRR